MANPPGGVLELTAAPPPRRGRWCRCSEYLLLGGEDDGRGLLAWCRGLGQDLHDIGAPFVEHADPAGRPGHRGRARAPGHGATTPGHRDLIILGGAAGL